MNSLRPRSRNMVRCLPFGSHLSIEQLTELAAELQKLRAYPPITKRADGKYEGDILGFVKGLRLSAKVIYFLREYLSDMDFEVSWGHLLDINEQSCSPECDVIIHNKGYIRKWNGGKDPIMEFKFIRANSARVVISCKSLLNSVDVNYPTALKKFGLKNIILFAECCPENKYDIYRKKAKSAGYKDLFVLYFTKKSEMEFSTDGNVHVQFGNCIRKLLHSIKPK